MNFRPIYFSVVFLLIIVCSILIFSVGIPETTIASSDDGVLTVTGLVRESQNLKIETLGSFLYQVDPEAGVLEEPLILEFNLETSNSRDFAVAAYWFDDEILMWKIVSSPAFPGDNLITIERRELGLFSVREYVEVAAPIFASTYDELLTMAPEGTVGYRLEVGFAAADGSVIQISGTSQRGGCGGVVQNGNSKERSQIDSTARVLVDDVETEVNFVFTAIWFVNQEGGCVDGLVLEPISL